MQLKTKLVLAAASVTFTIVVVLSGLFLGELLRQRIAQTESADDVMARQVLLMTRQAVEAGLRARPPAEASEESLHAAVADALLSSDALSDTMNGFVRYSPGVQDVAVTDAQGLALVSTDPEMGNRPLATRMSFERMRTGAVLAEVKALFGQARVLDVSLPLERNGRPFLVVHLGVRSTFLKNSYVPFLKDAFLLTLLCGFITMVAAGVLTNLALRPIEDISRRLADLTGEPDWGGGARGLALGDGRTDAVVRVTETIDRLGQQMRTTEAVYSNLQSNLDQMLDTLRDGVVLFTAERRAVMVSDAVANFADAGGKPMVGRALGELFAEQTALGAAVLAAFERGNNVAAKTVRMEDGREVEISLDRIDEGGHGRDGRMATLLTLRDRGSVLKLEQELEVSRRLAAVGRLTAGVGHEVKNPINAMVVHLELLRGKLEDAGKGRGFLQGAMRHVEILSSEMHRLDRVVQTLADFTQPMDLRVEELELCGIVRAVGELTAADMAEQGLTFDFECGAPVYVRGDGEMLRQALLNLVLNGMQAMTENETPGASPAGKRLLLGVHKVQDVAVVFVRDQGSGIAPEVLPRIFDLYFTTKATGSGIGLAMTYRIVQMHGGALAVSSEPGAGAVFTIRLPAAAGVEAREHERLVAERVA